jgi:hypothetical protein
MKTYKHFYLSFLTIPTYLLLIILSTSMTYSQTAQEWYDLGIDTEIINRRLGILKMRSEKMKISLWHTTKKE